MKNYYYKLSTNEISEYIKEHKLNTYTLENELKSFDTNSLKVISNSEIPILFQHGVNLDYLYSTIINPAISEASVFLFSYFFKNYNNFDYSPLYLNKNFTQHQLEQFKENKSKFLNIFEYCSLKKHFPIFHVQKNIFETKFTLKNFSNAAAFIALEKGELVISSLQPLEEFSHCLLNSLEEPLDINAIFLDIYNNDLQEEKKAIFSQLENAVLDNAPMIILPPIATSSPKYQELFLEWIDNEISLFSTSDVSHYYRSVKKTLGLIFAFQIATNHNSFIETQINERTIQIFENLNSNLNNIDTPIQSYNCLIPFSKALVNFYLSLDEKSYTLENLYKMSPTPHFRSLLQHNIEYLNNAEVCTNQEYLREHLIYLYPLINQEARIKYFPNFLSHSLIFDRFLDLSQSFITEDTDNKLFYQNLFPKILNKIPYDSLELTEVFTFITKIEKQKNSLTPPDSSDNFLFSDSVEYLNFLKKNFNALKNVIDKQSDNLIDLEFFKACTQKVIKDLNLSKSISLYNSFIFNDDNDFSHLFETKNLPFLHQKTMQNYSTFSYNFRNELLACMNKYLIQDPDIFRTDLIFEKDNILLHSYSSNSFGIHLNHLIPLNATSIINSIIQFSPEILDEDFLNILYKETPEVIQTPLIQDIIKDMKFIFKITGNENDNFNDSFIPSKFYDKEKDSEFIKQLFYQDDVHFWCELVYNPHWFDVLNDEIKNSPDFWCKYIIENSLFFGEQKTISDIMKIIPQEIFYNKNFLSSIREEFKSQSISNHSQIDFCNHLPSSCFDTTERFYQTLIFIGNIFDDLELDTNQKNRKIDRLFNDLSPKGATLSKILRSNNDNIDVLLHLTNYLQKHISIIDMQKSTPELIKKNSLKF